MIRVGIGGWDFAAWRGGRFYPAGLPRKEELAYASRRLASIEINATFYRRQNPATFRRWRDETPEDFVFSLKGPRFVTQGAELGRGLDGFLESGFDELGAKLGAVLWQFRQTPEEAALARFLERLPRGFRHAVELPEPSHLDLFRAHGVAVALVDADGHEAVETATAPFLYARLKRSARYDDAALEAWAERLRGGDGYVYFIAGAKERNPDLAQALIALLAR
jgi:uncharacterized protein YecE (DUF72 family)